jgi:hypothetical protein
MKFGSGTPGAAPVLMVQRAGARQPRANSAILHQHESTRRLGFGLAAISALRNRPAVIQRIAAPGGITRRVVTTRSFTTLKRLIRCNRIANRFIPMLDELDSSCIG